MVNLLHAVTIGLTIWLIALVGLAMETPPAWSLIITLSVGVLLIALAVSTMMFDAVGHKPWFSRLMSGVAFCLVVSAWFSGGSEHWYALIISLVVLVVVLTTSRLKPMAENFILHSAEGATLMEIKHLEVRGNDLVLRGKMMGTMPTSAHMKPEELRAALTMIPLSVILRLPLLLLQALRLAQRSSNQEKGQAGDPFQRVRAQSIQSSHRSG